MGRLIIILIFLGSGVSEARQTSPEVVNPFATIKSIDTDAKDRFANPSEPGIPAGDLNGDGELDFIQHWETWRDLKGFSNSFNTVTTFLSYNDQAETSKASVVDGTYFPVGDLDNNGITEVVSVNNVGYVIVHSISSSEEEDFIVSETGEEVISEQRYNSLSYTLPAFIDEDEFPDVLLCESSFFSFEECMILFGKGDEAASFTFAEFNFSELGIDFQAAPQLFLGESISGVGLGIYVMGTLSSTFQNMMYELGLGDENQVEVAFSHEWESSSGASIADSRFFIDDFDGDDELEILSSDDREFLLAGLQQIYFSTPWCDIRDVDYSGELPVLQSPEIISTNCLVDRVVRPDTSQVQPKARTSLDVNDQEPAAWIWADGNYASCSYSDLYNNCSNQTTVVNDQTTFPCSYNSCGSNYYYYSNTQYPYYYNGYANPTTSTRGLQRYELQSGSMPWFSNRSRIPESSRIAEIHKIKALFEANQTLTKRQLKLLYESGFSYSDADYSCSGSGAACGDYEQTNARYYKPSGANQKFEAEDRISGSSFYQHFQVIIPAENEDSNSPKFIIPFYNLTKEGNEDSDFKHSSSSLNQVATDSLSIAGTINLEALDEVDGRSGAFTIKNIGNIDGEPGEELLIGTNFTRFDNNPINKAWIYLGTNTTLEEPDVTIEFRNDSTINEFSFLQVGGVADNLGDVNGDGINDFGIGLIDYNRKTESSGGVYIFAGKNFAAKSVQNIDTLRTPIAILEPKPLEGQTMLSFGSQITGGDFDGDGFNDVAVLTDQGFGTPTVPTITVYKGGDQMDTEPDYFLYVTTSEVGGFGSDTLTSFFDAVIHFMPKNQGEDHQDLYFSPGGFSSFADAVIFKGANVPENSPAYTLAEAGPTSTGMGVFLRTKPAVGDFNQDGFYDVAVTKQFDGRDALISSRVLIFSPSSGIQVSDEVELENPLEYRLSQNYPNPFNPSTTIEFNLGESSLVTLKVFDILGREVATLVNNEPLNTGLQSIRFNASNLASGVYLYRLDAGGFTQTRTMILLK